RGPADEYGMIHLRAIALHRGVDFLIENLSHLDRIGSRFADGAVARPIDTDGDARRLLAGAREHPGKCRKPQIALRLCARLDGRHHRTDAMLADRNRLANARLLLRTLD